MIGRRQLGGLVGPVFLADAMVLAGPLTAIPAPTEKLSP